MLYVGISPSLALEWQAQTEITRAAMQRMDHLINSGQRSEAYEQYLAMFHPGVEAWGLYEDGAANLVRVRKHYHPVFFELGGGVLVSDDVVIAGPMAAQRYHSMMLLNGTFDGVEAKDKPVVIRGQTFFRFDESGRITERWSNHDHAYRMSQLLGEDGRQEGEKLAKVLNGPGLGEREGVNVLNAMIEAFNQPESPDKRMVDIRRFLSTDIKLFGDNVDSGGVDEAMNTLQNIWSAFPDLIVSPSATPLSAWSFVATRVRFSGSWRKPYAEQFKEGTPVCARGDLVIQLNSSGLVESVWLDLEYSCEG
jgi:hypothetical protein